MGLLGSRIQHLSPELTDPESLLALVLHRIQTGGGWWTFPLQLLTQPELLGPQSLLSAAGEKLEQQR